VPNEQSLRVLQDRESVGSYTNIDNDKLMTENQRSLPKWILIVSGIFALLEFTVSLSMFFSPESLADKVDINAKGVEFLICMWAVRQFALGFIFAFATFKRSIAMLTVSYIFFLVMFIGDFIVGFIQMDNMLMISAVVLCIISSALIVAINKQR
jgi:hypothetical protein